MSGTDMLDRARGRSHGSMVLVAPCTVVDPADDPKVPHCGPGTLPATREPRDTSLARPCRAHEIGAAAPSAPGTDRPCDGEERVMHDERSGPVGHWPDDDEPGAGDRNLPDHEIDRDTSIGGGMLGAAGTAANRTAGAPAQPAAELDEGAAGEPTGPPAHLNEDDEAVLDEPENWVFGGRSG
jgi:hypothetical protein